MALTAEEPNPLSTDTAALQRQYVYSHSRFPQLGGDPKYFMYLPDASQISPIKVERVMEDLVQTFLVSDAARTLGLSIPAEELRKRIYSKEWYDQETGKFRGQEFNSYVYYGLQTSLVNYEDFVEREMLREQMIDLLTAPVSAAPAEVAYYLDLQNTKVNLAFVELDPKTVVPNGAVDPVEVEAVLKDREADVRKYYDEHQAEFTTPEGIKAFDDAKADIATRLVREGKGPEAVKAAAAETEKWLAAVPNGRLDAVVGMLAARGIQVTPSETGDFARMAPYSFGQDPATAGAVPRIGHAPELLEAAFALTPEKPLWGKVYEAKDTGRFYVVELKSRTAPSGEEAATARKELVEVLDRLARRNVYLAWYENLKQQAVAGGRLEYTDDFQGILAAEQKRFEEMLKKAVGGETTPIKLAPQAKQDAPAAPAEKKEEAPAPEKQAE
jgi:hypothetical protein